MTEVRLLRVGIIGAAGLSAGRLMRLLVRHPAAMIEVAVSESSPGKPVWSAHPELRGEVTTQFESLDFDRLSTCDLVFSCKKAGETFPFIRDLLSKGVRFIDLSGDYRLDSDTAYQQWYGLVHDHPDLLKGKRSVLGLPEFYREQIRRADLVANPGCYTTTSILACAPLVAAGYGVGEPILINAISGVSGAGRNARPENQFLSVAENVRAYRIGNHQHTPEIEQELKAAATKAGNGAGEADLRVLFVPHVGPYKAGIMADCFLRVTDSSKMPTTQQVYQILSDAYAGEPFVRVYEPGTLPQVEYVVGTNYCDIGATVDPRTGTVVVISCTDNLMKGAAGQAVQNMNIMFGYDEKAGLT